MDNHQQQEQKPMDIGLMCDKCFRMLKENEQLYSITIHDDYGKEKRFQGHHLCIQYVMKELQIIYNK